MAINLYTVKMGNQSWYYTSNEVDITSNSILYHARPIYRNELSYDLTVTNMKLIVPSDLYPFSIYKSSTPILPIVVSISEYPTGAKKFEGRVLVEAFNGKKGETEISLGSIINLEQSVAPSATFSAFCRFELYDGNCTIGKSSWSVSANSSEVVVNGLSYTHSSFDDLGADVFQFGYILLDTGEAQYITNHSGTTITLLGKLSTLDVSSTLTVQAGCDKSYDICSGRFNNLPNFGGFPYIPNENPVLDGIF